MTVGITYKTQDKAVAIVDSRVGFLNRHSDNTLKSGTFKDQHYFGVMFGSGSGNVLTAALTQGMPSADALEEAINEFAKTYHENTEAGAQKIVDRYKTTLDRTQQILDMDSQVQERIDHTKLEQRLKAQQEAGDTVDKLMNTDFIITAYDKKEQRVRTFSVTPYECEEFYMPHLATGSGLELTFAYFTTKTPGLQGKDLSVNQLIRLVTGAYAYATFNTGVGGTPAITIISSKQEEAETLPVDQTTILTNLAGACEARIVSEEYFRKQIPKVLAKEQENGKIARELGITVKMLTRTTIPASNWIEIANRNSDF